MADSDYRLSGTLQENLMTLVCYDDTHGRIVTQLVDVSLFEGDYRIVMERAAEYWEKYNQAPKHHTADLVADILDDAHDRRGRTYRRILADMFSLWESGINTGYVMDQLQTFTRLQRTKEAILNSAERLSSLQEGALEEVEEIWNELLHTREVSFDSGMRLSDFGRIFDYVSTHYNEFLTGIPEFDKFGVVPSRGSVMLFLGAVGVGKSWFLIHLGKISLMTRKKVLHVSLEMSEEEVGARYLQALFSMSRRQASVTLTRLEIDEHLGRLSGFRFEELEPEMALVSPKAQAFVEKQFGGTGRRLDRGWGTRLGNDLLIKQFPTGSLTVRQLEGYLDNVEIMEGFIPDLILLDYIKLMRTDINNPRISLGHNLEEFRGLLIRRNCAGVTPQQISKKGAEALQARATHVAEDWSLVATSDIVLVMSQTDMERKYGLGRLFVGKSRSDRDKFGVLITQSYDIGQFMLDSHPLESRYQKYLDELEGQEEDEEQDDDQDEDG